MAKALGTAITAALIGWGTASCGLMAADRESGSAAGASTAWDSCGHLPEAEREYCMKRQSGDYRGWQAIPSDPKPSPSGY